MPNEYALDDLSLEGFQIVKGTYFAPQSEPKLAIWNTAIGFNPASFAALQQCDAVQLLVNDEKRRILVRPVSSSDLNSINWKKGIDAPKAVVRIECALFAKPLFDRWHLDPELKYRANGRIVNGDKKVMLLFDFTDPEKWRGAKQVRDDE